VPPNGIGLAIVEAFVGEGMRVTAADVDEENSRCRQLGSATRVLTSMQSQ